MITTLVKQYAAERDKLLENIAAALKQDQRFSAAWLTGSFGRNDTDEISDLDLTVVVSTPYAPQLCARPEVKTIRPPLERLELYSQFGKIGLAYENNNNAPNGCIATSVMYLPSGVCVDWSLVPEQTARYPQNIKLLFSRIDVPPIPGPQPANPADRAKAATEMLGFFWLMATVVAKYRFRGDGVFVTNWLEQLTGLVRSVERMIEELPDRYQPGSLTSLHNSAMEQLAQLKDLCKQVEMLTPQVVTLGGEVWPEAQAGCEQWLTMVEQALSLDDC